MNPQPPIPASPGGKASSCWLAGGIGCLIVIATLLIVFFVGVRVVMNTKTGKQLASGIKSAISAIPVEKACEAKMTEVHQAMTRYQAKNGSFPSSIAALTPDYLPDPTTCHCTLDKNPEPTHPTFTYTQPTAQSKPTDRVLTFTWTQNITIQNQTETVEIDYYYTVAGKEYAQQTVTDINGRVIKNQPVEVSGSTSQ